MISSSRVVRPAQPPGLRLQPRDIDVLLHVHRFRLLTAEHLQLLSFAGLSTRFCNRRLRLLWANGLLERRFLPEVVSGVLVRGNRPVYTLTQTGAAVLANARLESELPSDGRPSSWTLLHDLIATDLMVAVVVAARARSGTTASAHAEHQLRSQLSRWNQGQGARNRFPTLIPDGALTFATAGTQRPMTFAIEVVRAGAKAGNRSLLAKMERYVALNRDGFFKAAFGFEQVRAVLVVTTSRTRVETMRQLGTKLSHGRNLFWFTSYERKAGLGMTFAPERVLGPIWTDVQGSAQSLLPAAPPPVAIGDSPNHV